MFNLTHKDQLHKVIMDLEKVNKNQFPKVGAHLKDQQCGGVPQHELRSYFSKQRDIPHNISSFTIQNLTVEPRDETGLMWRA